MNRPAWMNRILSLGRRETVSLPPPSQKSLAAALSSPQATTLSSPQAALEGRIDDSPGWGSISQRPHDRDWAEIQSLYTDTLTAWRKNPIAWRIISITTDYVVGDRIEIKARHESLERFRQAFWNHRKNLISNRLEAMIEELSRAGDLFVVLFRDRADGLSYLRFVTKDQIQRIETAPNDWESELAYFEADPGSLEPRRWLSPIHPEAADSEAVMAHYAVNRPIGALMGESDLTTMIPWLLRYSRMLEDRVRLHWAARAFLYLVTVPATKVEAKTGQYNTPPESGSIIVKDASEAWEILTPNLRGADAAHDLKAVRGMIDAGAGYPPHWRGEGGDVNLATAEAMQAPSERHLLKRQKYFLWMLQDLTYQAYQRAVEIGAYPPLPTDDYGELFEVELPDIAREDDAELAGAARQASAALCQLMGQLPGASPTLARVALETVLKFAGEPQPEKTLQAIVQEAYAH